MSKYHKIYLSNAAVYLLGITIAHSLTSAPACCVDLQNSTSQQARKELNMESYGHIDAKTLKNLIDVKTPMVVLDARTKEWDDGRRIPSAKSLPFDSSPNEFSKVIPTKETLVVVHCHSSVCPAGRALVEKLISNGYTHIIEYSGGIKEWADVKHYPFEQN